MNLADNFNSISAAKFVLGKNITNIEFTAEIIKIKKLCGYFVNR